MTRSAPRRFRPPARALLRTPSTDQRALVGAFLSFLIGRTVDAVDRHYRDEKIPKVERDQLLDDFAPALLALDEILRYPVERKEALGTRRAELVATAEEAHADAQLADTMLKLRQDLFVPREALFTAARRHLARTQAPSTGPAAGAALPPPSGTRRLV